MLIDPSALVAGEFGNISYKELGGPNNIHHIHQFFIIALFFLG